MKKETTDEKKKVGLIICFLYIRETGALKQLPANYQTRNIVLSLREWILELECLAQILAPPFARYNLGQTIMSQPQFSYLWNRIIYVPGRGIINLLCIKHLKHNKNM